MQQLTGPRTRSGRRNSVGRRPVSDRATEFVPDDVLVFELDGERFTLVGGTGRGVGWAGIVDVPTREPSVLSRAGSTGGPVHVDTEHAHQVVGPYYAKHAVAIPVGHRFVVVVGSHDPIALSDAEAVRLAASAIDRTHGVPADKLIADELEVVQAIRALMAYRPETVRETLEHVATVAATALSCDVALAEVTQPGRTAIAAIDLQVHPPRRRDPDGAIEPAASDTMVVEQAIPHGTSLLGVDLASRISVPIGGSPALGRLVLAHAVERPRGFTTLCQRIARSVAEASELLISQAIAREQLAAERDLLQRISGTDALTGLANRRAWDAAVEAVRVAEPTAGQVLSLDLDGLKEANDRFGHAAGDALLRVTANLLNAAVRDADLIVRIGGDEFIVFLRGADDATARRVQARIRRAEPVCLVPDFDLRPRLSIGIAPVLDNDLDAARRLADTRMYANKRRRCAKARLVPETTPPDRRARASVQGSRS